MRVVTKFVLDSYNIQRETRPSLTHENQKRLRDQVRETRRVLKSDESDIRFSDVLKAVMSPRKIIDQH